MGRGCLPRLFDHTLSGDFRQYNHFPIPTGQNYAMIARLGDVAHFPLFTALLTTRLAEPGGQRAIRR
jgi:hypothetical protein